MKTLLVASWLLFGVMGVWFYISEQQIQLDAALAANAQEAKVTALESENADLKDENSKLTSELSQKEQQADSIRQQLAVANLAQQKAEDAQAIQAAQAAQRAQLAQLAQASQTAQARQTGHNGLPITRDEVTELYENGGTRFRWNLISIQVYREGQTVSSIDYLQDTSFNELQIESMLKSLSPQENWVQVSDEEWTLPIAHCSAHWDGERHLIVKAN